MIKRTPEGLYIVSLNWYQINMLDHVLYDVIADRTALIIKQKGFNYKDAAQFKTLIHKISEKFPASEMDNEETTFDLELTVVQARLIKVCMYFCEKSIYSSRFLGYMGEVEDMLDAFLTDGYKTLPIDY